MITQTHHAASYHGDDEEWEQFASWFEERGEKRLAKTIRDAIKNQIMRNSWERDYPLKHHGVRLRDGSIAKMNNAIREIYGL